MKKDMRITVFSPGWWFYVILSILGLTAFTLACRNMPDHDRLQAIMILSIIEFIILIVYKLSLRYIRSNYNFFNELPFYLCNLSTILCIIASIDPKSYYMGYCVSCGFFGALLAFLMPDGPNRDQLFFNPQAFGFYGYHSLLIITSLSFYTLNLYEPNFSDIGIIVLMMFLLTLLAHIVNWILRKTGLNKDANYIFTYVPDNPVMSFLYRIIPVRFVYLLLLAGPIAVLCWLEFIILP